MKRILHTSVSLTLLLVLLATGSCKKEEQINGLIASVTESKTENGQTTNTTTTYTYDSQQRLVEIQPSVGNPTTISYGVNQVTAVSGGATTVYNLNSNGVVQSDNNQTTYASDANGYITAITNGANSIHITIQDGDVVSQVNNINGATTNYGFTYLSKTDYRSTGQAYLGKNSTHLVNVETVSNPNTTTYTFSYTFDSKGRVQTQTYNWGSNTDVQSFTYTN